MSAVVLIIDDIFVMDDMTDKFEPRSEKILGPIKCKNMYWL